MSGKTLLQINVTANWGSHGKIAEDIGLLAIQSGWKSIIAYGRHANQSRSDLIRIGNVISVYEHVFETRIFDNHGLASRRATKKFISCIDELNPDIIHLHNIHGYYLNFQLLFEYLASKDIPIVWTLHDCWSFTGHCAYFDYVGCKRWKAGCYAPCPCKSSYPKSMIGDASEHNYALKKKMFTSVKDLTIVPVSDWLGCLLKESFLCGYDIRVINNGVDLQQFFPVTDAEELLDNYCLRGKHILLGVANIWEERKGFRDYIKLAEVLPVEWQIVLIGLKDSQNRSLPSNVLGLPRTSSQHELRKWYTLADIVLNLSYEETFGMTTIEGFACGTPGIVYNRTASVELEDNVTCMMVDAGNIEGLLRKIKIMGEKTEAISKACTKRAKEHFDKSKCFKKYLRLYEELLAK